MPSAAVTVDAYVLARAISSEQGSGAIGELIGLPGSAFVERYIHLKGYGKARRCQP